MSPQRIVRWTRLRRLAQVAVAALYLALPFLAHPALTGTMAALKVGPVELVEPAGALSAVLAAGALPVTLALGVLPVVLLGLALGPVYCSWVCPYGLLSEAIDWLRRSGGEGRGEGENGARSAAERPRPRLRATLLASLLLLSALLAAPVAAILSPARVLTVLPLEAVSARVVPWVTAALLAAFLAVELLGPRRIVCRLLCPAGAFAALLRRSFTWGPRWTADRCRCPPGQPICRERCAWALDPRGMSDRDGCTSCMACVEACPSGALSTLRRR